MSEGWIDLGIIIGSTAVLISVIYFLDKGLHKEPLDDEDYGSQADDDYTKEIRDWE